MMETAQDVGFSRGQVFQVGDLKVYIDRTRNERVYWHPVNGQHYPLCVTRTEDTKDWIPVLGVYKFWGKRVYAPISEMP